MQKNGKHQIKSAEDFGLGFNCMTRLYMIRYDEQILIDMIKICEEYLKWFSRRTIICSLRDLIKEYPFYWNDESVPENQTERYETLIKNLISQAIGKEKKDFHDRELRNIVDNVSGEIGVIASRWGKEKNFDRDTFYQWVTENNLAKNVVLQEVKENEILPIKKKCIPLFYKVCNYMIYYSYGRHTYMPSTCRDFVKENMELMSDKALKDIVEYLNKRNADIPEDESAFDRIDSETWISMQEELEAELLTRHIFDLAKEKSGNKKEIEKLLNGLTDLDSLHIQKDCVHMYHQLMGIERYLETMPDDVYIQGLLKQVEKVKKTIVEKRWEFFEKEEGDNYKKNRGRGISEERLKLFMEKNAEEKTENTDEFYEIKKLAESIKNISESAFSIYKPIVDDICSRKTVSERELEKVLDELLSLCISDKMLDLFKQVGRKFYAQYPEIITDYVMFYKEMYGEEEE